MGVVRYRCPTTNEDVATTIETGNDTLFRMKLTGMKIWVWCPNCIAGHQISPSEATLQDDSLLTEHDSALN